MDRMGSFPVMTEEQYQQALREYSFFCISYQVQLYRISRIDAPTELLNGAPTSSATRQAPAKDLVEALVASLAKYKDATALVVRVQESSNDKMIFPIWWERRSQVGTVGK